MNLTLMILEVPSNLIFYDSMKFKALHENLASALQPQTCLIFRALGTRGSPSLTEANNPQFFLVGGEVVQGYETHYRLDSGQLVGTAFCWSAFHVLSPCWALSTSTQRHALPLQHLGQRSVTS